MNNKIKFGYEDTDKKVIIDLYGLEFEVKNIDEDRIEELKNIDGNRNDIVSIIDSILGNGSVDRINEKRKNDGYPPMDLKVQMAVFGCIFQAYTKVMSESALGGLEKTMNEINDKANYNNYNRNQRRNYNRYENRGNKYRRY